MAAGWSLSPNPSSPAVSSCVVSASRARSTSNTQVLDQPLPDFQAVHLGGNHEAVMLKFLADAGIGPVWLRLGGDMTLFSYGIALAATDATPESIEEARAALRDGLLRRHFRFSYHK